MTLLADTTDSARPRESGDPVLPPHPALDSRLRGNEREGSDPLTRRRLFCTLIVLASMAGLIALLAFALTAGGFTALDFVLVVLFAITLRWSVTGLWNAPIALCIMRSADPAAALTPVSPRVAGEEPVTAK